MKLPPKLPSVGRPKGSGQTVIGLLKRKNTQRIESAASVPKKKFLDLNTMEQSVKLTQWLTNKSETSIRNKKVTYSDIIQDSVIFNRLRNEGIDLRGLKKYMDKACYDYIVDEVDRLNEKTYWACAKCKRNLNSVSIQGEQIMCNWCLDWFHKSCTDVKTTKNLTFFCVSCRNM